MARLELTGHYGRDVEVDLCEPCHLLWFDSLEASRLNGPSMIRLIGAMAASQARPHHALEPRVRCPRCAGPLKTVTNRSRFGVSEQLECLRGHGGWSSFAQWLADRGLFRPLGVADRAVLAGSAGWTLGCVNCGSPGLPDAASTCIHCGTQFGVVDLARLAAALDPERATEGADLHFAPRTRHAFVCHACGHSEAGQAALRCPRCGATQIATDLRAVHARIVEIEAPLVEHHRRPAPKVVQRRLLALEADLPRRRDTVRDLERDIAGEPATSSTGPWLEDWLHRMGVPEPTWVWRAVFWTVVVLVGAEWLAGS
jgi:Zn finger protein HypA/HybF involved in hydrogenase expression